MGGARNWTRSKKVSGREKGVSGEGEGVTLQTSITSIIAFGCPILG